MDVKKRKNTGEVHEYEQGDNIKSSELADIATQLDVLASLLEKNGSNIKLEENARVIFIHEDGCTCDSYIFPIYALSDEDYELLLLLNTPIRSNYPDDKIAKLLEAAFEFMLAINNDVFYSECKKLKPVHEKGVWEKYKVDYDNPARKGVTLMFSVFNLNAMISWLKSNKSRIACKSNQTMFPKNIYY